MMMETGCNVELKMDLRWVFEFQRKRGLEEMKWLHTSETIEEGKGNAYDDALMEKIILESAYVEKNNDYPA